MVSPTKRNVLGVLVDAIDYTSAVQAVEAAVREGRALTVTALAVHGIMTGVLDATHRFRLNQLDIVAPDGQPVRWALRLLHGLRLPDRVYGPHLMLEVCRLAEREAWPIYLYGSRERVLTALVNNLQGRFRNLRVAGMQASRFRQLTADEKSDVVQDIASSGARIVFVGLGCPRQEVWVFEHRDALHLPMLAVGAAFDFHAGLLSQAPARLQSVGLEWLYRLIVEPRRLWRRYVLLNPLYVTLVAAQMFKLARFDPHNASAPVDELRYG